MNTQKHASPDRPIHELIQKRWSPYTFTDKLVSIGDLHSVFEAARWAPSSYNEQPWSYIVATKEIPEEFQKVLACLVEPNQAWAKDAPVLAIGCTSLNFARNGKPNAAAQHDLGLASASLSLEATSRGLHVYQMIGILPDKVRETFAVPEGVLPLTALAIGYAADPSQLGQFKERDLAPRSRKNLNEFVFTGKWGTAAS